MVPISLHQELELQPVMLGPQAWEPSLLLWLAPLLPVLVHFPAVEATSASSSASQSIKLAKENPFLFNLFDFQNFLHYSTTQYILHPLFSFRLSVSSYFWQVYIFYTCHYILLKLYPSFWSVYLLSLNLGLLQLIKHKCQFRSRCGSVVHLFSSLASSPLLHHSVLNFNHRLSTCLFPVSLSWSLHTILSLEFIGFE